MKVNTAIYSSSYPVFKLESPLKTAFMRGELTIKNGIYGEVITRDNVTCEHLLPVSEGGGDDLANLALASSEMNSARGNKPLKDVLTEKHARAWLKQFDGRISQFFNVSEYRKLTYQTFIKLGVIRK